ncbi:hypothetical protein [Flavobacterium limi]|uniref:Uncharacterized protein n=1 Tax=Flavobacterium limi TaxID=2045105 RepID=A0ABQ1UVV2_9FLAO|nr:hypothetical protein [Flavobacterium limi]GGF28140.1 hypothetical protein GCM10011518_41820 [Flavobacterium limi]
MIPQQNYDTHYQQDSDYPIGEEQAHLEEMEHSEPAAGQLLSPERSADHQPTELDHDDADRRTLDESQADEDADDEH